MAELASYSESNQSNFWSISSVDFKNQIGQSWTNDNEAVLTSAKFYLMKTGSPTGNIRAKLYSHGGTYGSSSVGVTLLATSDNVDVSTLGGSFALQEFTFSGGEQYSLAASTYYVVSVEYLGGDNDDYVRVGTDNTAPSASGNMCHEDGGSWTASSGTDECFYVYGDVASAGGRNILLLGAG